MGVQFTVIPTYGDKYIFTQKLGTIWGMDKRKKECTIKDIMKKREDRHIFGVETQEGYNGNR